MKLMMHILKNNPKEKIDNERANLKTLSKKLEEEYKEVIEAVNDYNSCKSLGNLKHLIEELFDLIQVSIALLYKCHMKAQDLEEDDLIYDMNIKHKDKLASRGWIFKTGIEIDVKE